MIKKCEVCGTEFVARRTTAKYCSNRCRLMKQRGVEFDGELAPALVKRHMTNEDVLEVISQAHQVAGDLSRASMLTPAPICLTLKRIAERFEETLKSEGL